MESDAEHSSPENQIPVEIPQPVEQERTTLTYAEENKLKDGAVITKHRKHWFSVAYPQGEDEFPYNLPTMLFQKYVVLVDRHWKILIYPKRLIDAQDAQEKAAIMPRPVNYFSAGLTGPWDVEKLNLLEKFHG